MAAMQSTLLVVLIICCIISRMYEVAGNEVDTAAYETDEFEKEALLEASDY